jgi:hypothetical protein
VTIRLRRLREAAALVTRIKNQELGVGRWELGKSVAEGQALRNAIHVGWVHTGQTAQGTAAFGTLGLRQVTAARARAQDFSASRNLKTLGHGLLGFDAFGTSHKIFIAKERRL